MAKYRKKPVVIEAVQFDGTEEQALSLGLTLGPLPSRVVCVQTLEGPLRVSQGDWIITGVKGERYPCKPDVFSMTYEPA